MRLESPEDFTKYLAHLMLQMEQYGDILASSSVALQTHTVQLREALQCSHKSPSKPIRDKRKPKAFSTYMSAINENGLIDTWKGFIHIQNVPRKELLCPIK